MQFDMDRTKVKLVDVNPRAEMHGEDPQPAGDLKMTVDLTNDCLAVFHPALKSLLYHFDDSIQGDLVDKAQKHEKGWAPHLRMHNLGPIKWLDEVVGASVTVHYGVNGKADVVMEECKVNNFTIEPKQGGTVTLTFRVQAHPDEKGFGRLAYMIGTEVEVTIESQEE